MQKGSLLPKASRLHKVRLPCQTAYPSPRLYPHHSCFAVCASFRNLLLQHHATRHAASPSLLLSACLTTYMVDDGRITHPPGLGTTKRQGSLGFTRLSRLGPLGTICWNDGSAE